MQLSPCALQVRECGRMTPRWRIASCWWSPFPKMLHGAAKVKSAGCPRQPAWCSAVGLRAAGGSSASARLRWCSAVGLGAAGGSSASAVGLRAAGGSSASARLRWCSAVRLGAAGGASASARLRWLAAVLRWLRADRPAEARLRWLTAVLRWLRAELPMQHSHHWRALFSMDELAAKLGLSHPLSLPWLSRPLFLLSRSARGWTSFPPR